jgi:hypothetical protein
MYRPLEEINQNISKLWRVFSPPITVANQSRFTTNPPQHHHQNAMQKHPVFQNPFKNTRKKHKKSPGNPPGLFPTKSKTKR